MTEGRYYRAFPVVVGLAGLAAVVVEFDINSPWFFLGLTALLAAGITLNTSLIVRRSRTLDEEFDAGYRVGHRVGRRIGTPRLVHLDDRRRDGGVSKASIGSVAGVDPTPRRAAANAD